MRVIENSPEGPNTPAMLHVGLVQRGQLLVLHIAERDPFLPMSGGPLPNVFPFNLCGLVVTIASV